MKRLTGFIVAVWLCGVVAVAIPPQLELVSQIGGSSYGIAVDGTKGVVGEGGGLRVLDLSQPGNPVRHGKVLLHAGLVRAAVLKGNLAWVAAQTDKLYVVDVASPDAPIVVGSGSLAGGQAWNVRVVGAYAYVVSSDFTTNKGFLTVLKIAGTSLSKVAEVPLNHWGMGMCFLGKYMPVSSPDAITLVDMSNPEAPTVRWADWLVPQGTGVADILARGNILFGVRGADGLSSFDFSDIDAPQALDAIAPPGPFVGAFGSSSRVAISGDFAIVTVELAGVAVADISDPESLNWAALAKTDSPANGLALLGSRAIASSEEGGVWDVDVSDPTNPRTLGGYLFPGVIQGLAAHSVSRVHAACDMGGVPVARFLRSGAPRSCRCSDRAQRARLAARGTVRVAGRQRPGGAMDPRRLVPATSDGLRG